MKWIKELFDTEPGSAYRQARINQLQRSGTFSPEEAEILFYLEQNEYKEYVDLSRLNRFGEQYAKERFNQRVSVERLTQCANRQSYHHYSEYARKAGDIVTQELKELHAFPMKKIAAVALGAYGAYWVIAKAVTSVGTHGSTHFR